MINLFIKEEAKKLDAIDSFNYALYALDRIYKGDNLNE